MSRASELGSPQWAMLTDLYELTMAYGYWQHEMAEREAVFYLSFRAHPFEGRYTIACGLGELCAMLCDFTFTMDDIEYLTALRGADGESLFAPSFLLYLGQLRFSCDVDAVPEGTIVFPHEPLLRVRGPLLQAQIVESLLLNVINFQSLIATKAARICRAAAPGTVLEFGLRRAQGYSGALAASRAAYVGGCHATSNVLAGKRYGIPVRGTHAHSWVMSFESELEAFERYASALPNNGIFLVDTYDTQQGIARAIQVALQLRRAGHAPLGIRLDSGDLAVLSRRARRMLDEAGLHEVRIVASNDLDEYAIASLRDQGAKIDIWGVGTRLVTAYDQPALGGVYKLSALRDGDGQWRPKLKLSEQAQKGSLPGMLQTRRWRHDERYVGDMIYDELTGGVDSCQLVLRGNERATIPAAATGEDLLVPVFQRGRQVYSPPPLEVSRRRTMQQLADFDMPWWPESPRSQYPVGLEPSLDRQRRRLVDADRRKS